MIKDLRVNETNKTKDYFIDEVRERELMSKRLSKYIPSFDYFDKSLIVLSAISSASFSFSFSITAGIVKKAIKNNTK